MTTIRRLTNSCFVVATDEHATLFDPGFFTFQSGEIDLESIGELNRILITHEHADHVNPEFVKFLRDRSTDVTVYSNPRVADILAEHDIPVVTDDPPGVSSEDVLHELLPTGAQPPNRSYTIDGIVTHPGDSYQPLSTAPVLALPLIIPWGSTTSSVAFAKRLGPQQVIPIHDFYLSESGRSFIYGLVGGILAEAGIEMVELDWGDGYTV